MRPVKDYVPLPQCGFVERKGPDVVLWMTAEVAETLAVELQALADKYGDHGWLDMASALFDVATLEEET